MIDPTVRAFADQVRGAVGGPIVYMRREVRVLCPVHEADGTWHRPSLAIWPRPGGGVAFNCMVGCPHSQVREALAARGIAIPGASNADWRCGTADEEAHKAAQRRLAQALYDRGSPVTDGDPSMLYLAGRGIHPKPEELTFFRTVRGDRPGEWLLVAAILLPNRWRGADLQAIGVQRNYIDAVGTAFKINGKTKRLTLGQRAGGGVIIGPYCNTAVVGEGVETTWSAMRLLGLPFGIATLGALDQLVLPAYVNHAIISVDADDAGEEAAERARQRWRARGRTISPKTWGPAGCGLDANDILVAGRH